MTLQNNTENHDYYVYYAIARYNVKLLTPYRRICFGLLSLSIILHLYLGYQTYSETWKYISSSWYSSRKSTISAHIPVEIERIWIDQDSYIYKIYVNRMTCLVRFYFRNLDIWKKTVFSVISDCYTTLGYHIYHILYI